MNNVARTGWHLLFRVKSNVFTVVAKTPSAELAARRGLGFFALLLPAACAALGSYSYSYGFAGSYSYGYGLAAPRTRIAAVDESEGYHEQWTHEGLLFTCAPDARVTLARLGEFGVNASLFVNVPSALCHYTTAATTGTATYLSATQLHCSVLADVDMDIRSRLQKLVRHSVRKELRLVDQPKEFCKLDEFLAKVLFSKRRGGYDDPANQTKGKRMLVTVHPIVDVIKKYKARCDTGGKKAESEFAEESLQQTDQINTRLISIDGLAKAMQQASSETKAKAAGGGGGESTKSEVRKIKLSEWVSLV